MWLRLSLIVLVGFFLPGLADCDGVADKQGSQATTEHFVTYSLPSQQGVHLYRIKVQAGASPEDISLALDSLGQGNEDEFLNISPDASWLVLSTDRFDTNCVGWPCLAVVPESLSSAEVIKVNGTVLHPEGFSAISSGGNMVVYPSQDGPHGLDLWAVSRSGQTWNQPVLLTGGSSYQFNMTPAISADGNMIVFECDADLSSLAGTGVCQVNTDGTGFQVVITPADGPGGTNQNALRQPDFAYDGSIVFEADWSGEQVWRLPQGSSTPERVSNDFNNDNSPCVLSDGRIVSLWLDRPGGQGYHELKVMSQDGSSYFMLLQNIDIADIGIGCGSRAVNQTVPAFSYSGLILGLLVVGFLFRKLTLSN